MSETKFLIHTLHNILRIFSFISKLRSKTANFLAETFVFQRDSQYETYKTVKYLITNWNCLCWDNEFHRRLSLDEAIILFVIETRCYEINKKNVALHCYILLFILLTIILSLLNCIKDWLIVRRIVFLISRPYFRNLFGELYDFH